MNKNLRTLKRQVADACEEGRKPRAARGRSKGNLEASMKLEPAKTKDVPAGEKAAYLDKYKKQ